ncbi:unnamed protein product [Auanema sp. JU1783]|nr:unnamed protein product [Auanema sp. JU1783]
MEKLEIKQRECLELEQTLKHRSTDSCSSRKWQLKTQLNGLHLRRTELARDCLQSNLVDAVLSETTLTSEMQTTCSSLHKKFAFAPKVSSNSTVLRRKRSVKPLKRNKRENSKKPTKIADCRASTRSWHKHCSALAHCCPLTEDCQVSTKEIMEQIFIDRRKLRELKEECDDEDMKKKKK